MQSSRIADPRHASCGARVAPRVANAHCCRSPERSMTSNFKGVALISLGIVLAAFAALASYWLSYKHLPARRLYSERWMARASLRAMTEQVTESIQRGVWPHDAFSILSYGDGETVAFIIAHIPKDQQIDDCDMGHVGNALQEITNQDPGNFGRDWLSWWKTNSGKRVVDWVSDGFEMHGISVSTNGGNGQVNRLLAVVGQDTSGTNVAKYPSYVSRNAIRWLRDLNVRPIDYILTNDVSRMSPDALTGLRKYGMLYSPGAGPSEIDQRLWKRRSASYKTFRFNWFCDTRVFDMLPLAVAACGIAMILGGMKIRRTRPSTVTSTRGTPAAGAPGAPGFRSGHG